MPIYKVKKMFVYLLIISLSLSSISFPDYSNAAEVPIAATAALKWANSSTS